MVTRISLAGSESKPVTRVECRSPRATWLQAGCGLLIARQLCPGTLEVLAVPIPAETWLWKSLLVGFPMDNLIC